MRRPVQGLRCPAVTTAYNASAARGKQISGQLRHLHRQAGTEVLLEFSGSSTSAEPPQKSLTIRERGMRDRVGKRRLRLASSMPLTPMGKSTDRHLPSWHRQCCAPRVNIIYRDCVTSFGAPSPNLFSRCTQSRLCSNLLCINKFSRCASNPPCRVGRQHWVRSACRSTLHNASPRTTCPASWAAACGQSGSRNLRR